MNQGTMYISVRNDRLFFGGRTKSGSWRSLDASKFNCKKDNQM